MSSEEFEQLIKEARMAGLKGDIKTSMIKYVRFVQIVIIRYINVMSQLESQIDSSSEEEKPVLKAKLQECVDEYNTLRSGHPDITIFTDELDRHSVVDDVLSGVSSAIQYGFSGIKSFLETVTWMEEKYQNKHIICEYRTTENLIDIIYSYSLTMEDLLEKKLLKYYYNRNTKM